MKKAKHNYLGQLFRKWAFFLNKGKQSPPDLEEIWKTFNQRVAKLFGKKKRFSSPSAPPIHPKKLLTFAGIVCLLAYLGSGVFFLNKNEAGFVMQFGKFHRLVEQEGTYWHLPYPFATDTIVNTSQDYILNIGNNDDIGQPYLNESSMLTKDAGIVNILLSLSYQIKNVPDYLLNANSTAREIHIVAQTVMRHFVAQKTSKDILTMDSTSFGKILQQHIQRILDQQKNGVNITRVSINHIGLPERLSDSLAQINQLKQENQRAIEKAQKAVFSYVPDAQAKVIKMLEQAHTYAQQTILDAHGDVARFNAVYQTYKKMPEAVKTQLYMGAMKHIYQRVNKVYTTGQQPVHVQLPKASTSPSTEDVSKTSATPFDFRSREAFRQRLTENNE